MNFDRMIHRIVCILLIPTLLASQGVWFMHTHRGTAIAEQEEHSSRPHFHIVGEHSHPPNAHREHEHSGRGYHTHHGNHDHSNQSMDGDTSPPIESVSYSCDLANLPKNDHNLDAIYCGAQIAFQCVSRAPSTDRLLWAFVSFSLSDSEAGGPKNPRLLEIHQTGFFQGNSCPIYLLTLSLRI